MFKKHPQKPCGLVQGRVKKEKRKFSLPSPQIPKKPKIQVKEENFWLAVIVWGHCSFLIYIISFSLNTLNHYRFLSFFFFGARGELLWGERMLSETGVFWCFHSKLFTVLTSKQLFVFFSEDALHSLPWKKFLSSRGKVCSLCWFGVAFWKVMIVLSLFDLTDQCVAISKPQPRKSWFSTTCNKEMD